jgi:hypothetical protein
MEACVQLSVTDRIVDGHAYDEQEKGEDEVGGCAAIPFGMFERRVDMTPVAGIVDEDHRCYGQSAEKVQGYQAT